MSELADRPQKVDEGKLFTELFLDPNQAQFVEDILQGRKPHVPSDRVLRMRYVVAAGSILHAPEDQRSALESIVWLARMSGWSDEDYANADFGINPPAAITDSEPNERVS